MVNKWVKKILGIDELENRVNNLEGEKANLESKLIASEQDKEHLATITRRGITEGSLDANALTYLGTLNLTPTQGTTDLVMQHLDAAQIVEIYGFERYAPTLTQGIPSPVISIKDLRDNPAQYIHKLTKGFLNFPIGINLSGVNKTIESISGNFKISNRNSPSGVISMASSTVFGQNDEDPKCLGNITSLARINSYGSSMWNEISGIDFLHNFEGLIAYVNESENIPATKKESAIKTLTFARFAYMTAIETVGTTQIGDLSDLMQYDSAENHHLKTGELTNLSDADRLKYNIKTSLLAEPLGTKHSDIEGLLPIRSIETFKDLASKITAQILAKDKTKKGITTDINKPIEEYSIGEALVLSCYFARHVITKYKKLEDNVKDLLMGKDCAEVSGKCTDYTGLALHYLREYLAPMQPEKFRNWKFGFDKDIIGDYKHCYMKLMHINEDQTVDVYFADPTVLASKGISELKTTGDIAKAIEGLNLPLQITRDAEDLMYAANENMKAGLDSE